MSDGEVDAAAGASVTAFGGLRIVADDRLLQPREWTVAQAEWAAELAADAPDGALLELCCGAGQIGLLAARLTGRPLLAVDQDPVAVRQTEANARAAGLDGQVQTRRGRINEVLDPDDRFAIVLADPPWVPHAQITCFPQDPPVAIDGGAQGLDVARTCLRAMADHLLPGGHGVLQLGTRDQVDQLATPPLLSVVATREFPRGVLVDLVRLPD